MNAGIRVLPVLELDEADVKRIAEHGRKLAYVNELARPRPKAAAM